MVTATTPSPLRAALLPYRSAFRGVIALSATLNVLTLAGSIYMMLVYDMILPSRSIPSLIGLLAVVAIVYAFQGAFDMLRTRLLSHVAASLDVDLAPRIHRLITIAALRGRPPTESLQPSRDLDQIRAFLSSPAPISLIDLPWVLMFLILLSLFHIWLGITTLFGAAVLIGLAWRTDRASREPARLASELGAQRMAAGELSRRHAEELRALGMGERTESAWVTVNARALAAQQRLAILSTGNGGLGRIFRMLLQSLVLTVGALLVIDDKATGGVIFASSILSARALAPIDQSISNWRNFAATRLAWARLDALLDALPPPHDPLALPAPAKTLTVEHLTLAPPGARPTVFDASFELQAGQAASVIGASASGKSSLARGIVGIWPALSGKVRLDGGAIDQWTPEALGQHMGYLPQSVALIDGTIAQNIARFDGDARDEEILAAAVAAGVHEMILHFPEGYETQVGNDGTALSAGQRQRIALARALFRDPFLVVLDEPNSNLDSDGEAALHAAIAGARARGAVVIVVAHRPGVLEACDLVIFMQEGRIRAFGPKEEVLPRILGPRQALSRDPAAGAAL